MKTDYKDIVKLNSMKDKTEMFNYSPSEFAFGFESCKRCYYDKKVNGIELKVPFPGIFSKFDSLQKNFYHGKSCKTLTDKLEDGEIVGDYNKRLQSEILYDLKDRPFTMSGYIDGYIKHKDSFTIVDFKTTKIDESKNLIKLIRSENSRNISQMAATSTGESRPRSAGGLTFASRG